MFDLGFSELLVIAVVALIVLGPERLPRAAQFVGVWVRRARTQWSSVKDELERDMAADEFKRSLQETRDALRDTERSIHDSGDEARREFEQMRAAVASDGNHEDRTLGSASSTPEDRLDEPVEDTRTEEAEYSPYDADEEARHELEREHAMTRDTAQTTDADDALAMDPEQDPAHEQDGNDDQRRA